MARLARLWGIRHVRWVVLSMSFWDWWDTYGCHYGAVPNPADLQYLEDVWKGEA